MSGLVDMFKDVTKESLSDNNNGIDIDTKIATQSILQNLVDINMDLCLQIESTEKMTEACTYITEKWRNMDTDTDDVFVMLDMWILFLKVYYRLVIQNIKQDMDDTYNICLSFVSTPTHKTSTLHKMPKADYLQTVKYCCCIAEEEKMFSIWFQDLITFCKLWPSVTSRQDWTTRLNTTFIHLFVTDRISIELLLSHRNIVLAALCVLSLVPKSSGVYIRRIGSTLLETIPETGETQLQCCKRVVTIPEC